MALRLTPTQQRIYDVLSDGKPHTPTELMSCLWDEQAGVGSLRAHISTLRQLVRPTGAEIVTRWDREIKGNTYRLVSLIVMGTRDPTV